jgi:shikimate kinase
LIGLDFVDTDHVFVDSVGMEIAEYIDKNGWEAFRDRETEILKLVAGKEFCIIGCGGGIVLREKNREILKTGITLYLETDPAELARRLTADPNAMQRPSLTGKSIADEVNEVLAERESLYVGCADLVLPQGEVDEIAEYASVEISRLS